MYLSVGMERKRHKCTDIDNVTAFRFSVRSYLGCDMLPRPAREKGVTKTRS